jgi:polar amino acid transport system substrate-binding protein
MSIHPHHSHQEEEMKRSFWLVLTALIVASLVLPACGPAKGKVYTVAMDATWPPFEFTDESGNIIGFDVDMINAIAAEEGFEIEIVNVAWDPLLAGMATCNYDIAASAMTITEDRAKSFNFSEPYFAAGQLVAVTIDNTDINGKDDLSGKTIGVQLGTTGDIEAQAIAGATVKSYDQVSLAFLDLMNGQIDAIIADNTLVYEYVNQNPDSLKYVGDVFTAEMFGIAVCKDETDLLDMINHGLAAIKAQGVLDDLVAKWFSGGE